MKKIPLMLCLSRFFLGPVVIAVSFTGPHPVLFLVLLLAGILSDILDGILARRWGVATPRLRELDSQADLVFWLCTAVAAYVVYPEVVREHSFEVLVLMLSEAMTYVVSYLKFRRFISTHALIAKFFGLALFAALTSLLCFGVAGVPFYVMLSLGLIANLEIIAIIFILPRCEHDIPSWRQALRVRRGLPVQRKKMFN